MKESHVWALAVSVALLPSPASALKPTFVVRRPPLTSLRPANDAPTTRGLRVGRALLMPRSSTARWCPSPLLAEKGGRGNSGGGKVARRKRRKKEKKELTPLEKIGALLKTAWSVLLLAATAISVYLAVDAVQKLRTQPITLDTLLPTLGNLLPLASFGYLGALRIAGAVVRLIRILLTIPVLAGGAYLVVPQLPSLLKDTPDVATGGLLALLATPEVLEALALIAIVVSAVVWVARGAYGAASGLMGALDNNGEAEEYEDDEEGDYYEEDEG